MRAAKLWVGNIPDLRQRQGWIAADFIVRFSFLIIGNV
jgi:hypothetical protein